MKENSSTNKLNEVLKSTKVEDITSYTKEYLSKQPVDFVSYISELIIEKGLKRQDIFQKADLSQKYGYKLLNGETHTTNRDKLLRIFISMNMTLKQTQRALALYELPALYPKKKRDAVIIIAFNKGISSIDIVNEWLKENNEEELSKSKD